MSSIKLIVDGSEVDLPENTPLVLVETNLLLSDGQGSYTYPFSLPVTAKNNKIFNHPGSFSRRESLQEKWNGVLYIDNITYSVVVTITGVNTSKIDVSAAVDGGTFGTVFGDLMLGQFLDGEKDFRLIGLCIAHLSSDDLSAEPYSMAEEIMLGFGVKENQDFVINRRYPSGLFMTKDRDYIDDNTQSVNPMGYGIVPFLRLSWVLKKLFGEKLNVRDIYDAEKEEILIVCNNVDAIIRSKIVYSQLVPEIKAVDFIKAVEHTFGGKFVLEGSNPRWISYKSWLNGDVVAELDAYLLDRPTTQIRVASQISMTQDNGFSKVSLKGYSFDVDGIKNNFDGQIGSEPPYQTIQECVKVWPGLFATEVGARKDATYSYRYNLFSKYDQNYIYSTGKVERLNTIICGNTVGHSPDWCKEKKEIAVPVTGACRIPGIEYIFVPVGPNWVNSTITSVEQKTTGKSDCICFLFQRGDELDIRGFFSPQTWGNNGIYKQFYTELDMFLRHSNMPISVKLDKRIKISPHSKYLLMGQPVVVELITDDINTPYRSVSLRTTRLQQPYDIDKEIAQPDGQIRLQEKVDVSENTSCEGTTLVGSRTFRYKYTWYDGRVTYDDFFTTETVYDPNSPKCGYIPSYTVIIHLQRTNCSATGQVRCGSQVYNLPLPDDIIVSIPCDQGQRIQISGVATGSETQTVTVTGMGIDYTREDSDPTFFDITTDPVSENGDIYIYAIGKNEKMI